MDVFEDVSNLFHLELVDIVVEFHHFNMMVPAQRLNTIQIDTGGDYISEKDTQTDRSSEILDKFRHDSNR